MNVKTWLLGLLATGFATAANAQNLIANSTMELGDIGKPTPGFMLKIYHVDRKTLVEHPQRKYLTVTHADGKEGKCLMVPAYPGVKRYSIEAGDITIHRDAEVELSLDAKIGQTKDGVKPNVRFFIDFRTLGDSDVKSQKNWSHPNYPIITGLSGRPTTEWQHFSQTVKVIKWKNVYEIYLWVVPDKDFEDLNAPFYLDNFKVSFVGRNAAPQEEAAIIPDRPEACYFKGDTVSLKVNALLTKTGSTELELKETSFPFSVRKLPVTLTPDTTSAPQQGLARFTGALTLKAQRYGAYRCTLLKDGKPMRSVGMLNVIHRPVTHKRFSPGWSIGFNSHEFNAYNTPYEHINDIAMLHVPNSLEQVGRFATLTGFKNTRIWGKWYYVEREKNHFDRDVIDSALKPFENTDVEPFFVIAAGAGMSFIDHGPQGPLARYPHYIYPDLTTRRKTYQGNVRLLSEKNVEDFKRYLTFCLNTWGDKIKIWELFNEPGVLDMDTKPYMAFLKCAYKMVKDKDRNFLFLGNGNTCDVGYDKGWCRRLTAADPHYTDHLDAIAFHPYYNATDYQGNVYNLYSKHIAELRDSMKTPKPLFNTECYYITNARQPQINFYKQKGRCTAEAVQRHYLDGMLNDVKMAASPDNNFMFYHNATGSGERTLSEGAVAINALSALLENMESLKPVTLNPFMRAGIFQDQAGKQALGFVYDLRASGSRLMVPQDAKVSFFDLFGNPLQETRNLQLAYEPLYLKGTPEQVKHFFQKARFIPMKSCRIFAMKTDDTAYLTAVNLTGQPGVMEIDFQQRQNLPSVRFEFPKGSNDSTTEVPLQPQAQLQDLPFKVFAQDAELGGGTITLLPERNITALPGTPKEAKVFTLSRGTQIHAWDDGRNLNLKATVKTDKLTPAPNANLWDGDAVEIFVDPAPFAKPETNQIISTNPLDCYQFVFAATPSQTGQSLLGISRANPAFKTKAQAQTTKTPTGYDMTVQIPWSEIHPRYQGIIGLEVEIARPHETGWKESLSNASKPAYAQRQHYPLFQRQEPQAVRNGSFTQQEFGDAAYWHFAAQSKYARITCQPSTKETPRNTVVFNTQKLVTRNYGQYMLQKIRVPQGATRALVTVLAEMPQATLTTQNFYRWRPHGFFITLGKSDMSHDRNTAYTKPFPWTVFQYYVPLQKGEQTLELSLGTRKLLGILKVADVAVDFLP